MKAAEINISNKGYIRDWWKSNDLGDLDNVERLELRLKNKAVKSIDDARGKKIDFNKKNITIFKPKALRSHL